MSKNLESIYKTENEINVDKTFVENSNIKNSNLFELAEDHLSFWDQQAEHLDWFSKWTTTHSWKRPYSKWFINGKINACYNCIDRHIKDPKKASKLALVWQSESGKELKYSYHDLYKQINKVASFLSRKLNVKKGDRVTLYMPLIPELLISVLACARIGAIHSVVFGGFSASALKDRLIDSKSSILITADGGERRGKKVPLLDLSRQALSEVSEPLKTLVFNNIEKRTPLKENEFNLNSILDGPEEYIDCEKMDSEDILFLLYTSGTTGKPKGIIHTTGGYLTHAQYSTKLVFDLKEDDIFWCTADIGWITGHTYLVYGPLLNNTTVFMYEGTPDYPSKRIFWELIEKNKISIFYTAPTAIRSFMKWGESFIKDSDLSSLRLLGSVGEPINPEAWMWYYKNIGSNKCPIVDTWWQTETGGIMISSLPGIHKLKPGYAGEVLPGIEINILDDEGIPKDDGAGYLSITKPWPSMLRGIWNDNQRFEDVYWSKYDTYFAGDGATIKNNKFKVLGRVDDVVNVAGHRIGTMEVESALVDHKSVAEAAVVGIDDSIKGQALAAFVILKAKVNSETINEDDIKQHVSKIIGAIAKPKNIYFVPDLPKTRSGKIMRRLLKNILSGNISSDKSTLANPDVLDNISKIVNKI